MASCSGNGSRGHHKFTLNVNETYVSDGANNYSTVSWSLVLSPIVIGYNWDYSGTVPVKYSVTINGTTYTGNIMSYNGSSTVTVASGSLNVTHNSDGSKSINFSFNISENISASYLPGSASGNGSLTLTKIGRYLTITEFKVTSTNLNSITCKWATDVARDWTWYSLNGGAWINAGDTVASNNKSGTFTINNLNPNTKYTIKIRLKRTDSQLNTDSSAITGTTKDIAKISNATNFNHGDNASVTITNPADAVALLVMKIGNTQILSKNLNTGANTISFTDEQLDSIYKKYGSSNSVTVNYILTTSSNASWTSTKSVTCTLKGNQKTIKNKMSGSWKRGKLWIKVSGTWRRAVIWIKINGTWRRAI